MSQSSLTLNLSEHPLRLQLVKHQFFDKVRSAPLSIEQTAILLGQWWHPLHFFPTFLACCIAELPDISSKCAVANILHQEVGQGNPKQAHESIYVETMKNAGFVSEKVTEAEPFEETALLLEGYKSAAANRYKALGFLFATEYADLAMVSGIGMAVRRSTGVTELEWVDIHIQQEPNHVEESDRAMLNSFTPKEQRLVASGAEFMWDLWLHFFDRLEIELFSDTSQLKMSSIAV
jgi:pyrroloquinoline quinone (PQQ) biosynthesis protein C